jgi:putative phosphonate metabolism protein
MRHAIYFAPAAESLFHALGSRWIGRDAFTGEILEQPDVAGIGVVTGDPRRYGFHATLKPPFVLRDSVSPEALLRAAAALAANLDSLTVRLKVGVLDQFLALVPAEPSEALQQLAERAVRDLDGFRQPPSADDLARRRLSQLTPSQERHLAEWGYPYVFGDFRFHMTLTERLPPAYIERYRAAAEAHFAPVLAEPVVIDGITLFEEASYGAPFHASRQFPLCNASAEAAA